MIAHTRSRHRRPRFLAALPPYQGGKRKLLSRIARALPPPHDAPVLLDPFLGGGSVSLWAKARGYRVICNDVALRSAIVGRALIQNGRERLTDADIVQLLRVAEERSFQNGTSREPSRTLPGGPSDLEVPPSAASSSQNGRQVPFSDRFRDVLPARHLAFLEGALPHALRQQGPKGALLQLLLLRFVMALRPMGNWGARTIVRQMSDGDWESINPSVLRDHLVRRIEEHPKRLLAKLVGAINEGVFANGHSNEAHQADVFDFLDGVEGSVVYLDPPYAGTDAYETALRPLDELLGGRSVMASEFSGPRGLDALDELLAACRHIPHLVLSYGNRVIEPEDLEERVRRHRDDVQMTVTAYAHLAGLATKESKQRNREVLIAAGRAR